jgi:predicted DNA-binding ribbon-helix-helix protein
MWIDEHWPRHIAERRYIMILRRTKREVGFSDDEYSRLQQIALERGLSFSALIRNLAVEHFLLPRQTPRKD